MKYLSLAVFLVALVWTWNVIHKSPDVSFETHSGIQERLAQLIQDTIKAKKPNSISVVINKMWTETTAPDRVKAFFEYSYTDQTEEGEVTSTIHGEGLLQRQGDDGSGQDRWSLVQMKTTSDAIVFEDGLIVTTGTPAEEAPATATE